MNKNNLSFVDWYKALQDYAVSLGGDWANLITYCGEKCWIEMYNDGYSYEEAIEAYFSE